MRLREFIGLVGGAVAWPTAVRGQQPRKVRRIGFLSGGSPAATEILAGFPQGMRELGYLEG